MNTAYFSNIANQIIDILHNANKEVSIAMAWFTNERLLKELIECARKGVDVSLILLDSPINWMPYAPDFNEFMSAGGNMFIADSFIGFMHHKFCVVDKSVTITGSYNWTHYAEIRNIENIVVSDEQSLSVSFLEEFSRLKNKLSRSNSAPRMSWEEIESSPNVNVDELNCEIREIAHVREIPEYVVSVSRELKVEKKDKTETVIQVIETPKIAKSKYEIGIETDDSQWVPFIKIGQNLPHSETREMIIDNRELAKCQCLIDIKDGIHVHGKSILQLSLGQIAGASELNDKVEIKVSMEKNGYLHVEVIAKKNKKAIDASMIDMALVNME